MKLPPKPTADPTPFINAGGSVPTPATPPADEKEQSGFSLRLYTSKLRELTAARDARRAQAKANKQPNVSAISVHSLILEAIDLWLAKEAKRSAASDTKGGTTKPTKRHTAGSTE